MSIPYQFNFVTERDGANAGLAIGITQASIAAATVTARGDKSHGLTGALGDSGPVSGNPLALGPAPAPNYIQPGTANPAARAGGTVSRKNPMGL